MGDKGRAFFLQEFDEVGFLSNKRIDAGGFQVE